MSRARNRADANAPDDSITSADLAPDIVLTGGSVGIPSVTTANRPGESGGTNASQTATVGMIIYNTTTGTLQQYNAQGWASIDSPPTVTSLTYPDSSTALDPAGSSTATIVITGTNFSVGVTVTIDGTAPTSTTRNSSTQVTITGYPAKAAATYAAGLVVTNPTGLSGSIDIVYDAIPAWTTAVGGGQTVDGNATLGQFNDRAYTNSGTTIRIVAAEDSDTIDYAQTNSAGVVNTDGVQGLTLGTTGANAGYLTGTLASAARNTIYNFYAKPTDDEGQIGAVRLFNIISSHAVSGGTIIESSAYTGDYRSHTFLSTTVDGLEIDAATTCNILGFA